MNYTKGPWEWEEGIYLVGVDGATIFEGYKIREIDDNMRLIAAAPDLLEACESLMDAFGIDECDCGTDGSDCATCMALAAIKKAKGGG